MDNSKAPSEKWILASFDQYHFVMGEMICEDFDVGLAALLFTMIGKLRCDESDQQ